MSFEYLLAEEDVTDRLLELTKTWTHFEDVRRTEQEECKRLGKRLNELGGQPLMVQVCREVHAANPAASVLAAYWEGIGDWQW
jgi:hypothetical protein